MKRKRWERNLTVILLWILFSLLAIAYIGDQPYLGLAIAIGGGIIMGVVAFLNFETTMREERALQDASGTGSPEAPSTPSLPTDDPQGAD
ncbi:MAG: hypothetical protein A2Z04_05130 [Chloroflexi bacterium RBG_16_57_9]|nr:MAG: hypothetical protein A2Z04_05130 [Chloroflexi bacterium RBG_16_57_9]